jgi:hypothetical protein
MYFSSKTILYHLGEQTMTAEQSKLQDALNTAYFAFAANPADKTLAAAYDAARDALFNALMNKRG